MRGKTIVSAALLTLAAFSTGVMAQAAWAPDTTIEIVAPAGPGGAERWDRPPGPGYADRGNRPATVAAVLPGHGR